MPATLLQASGRGVSRGNSGDGESLDSTTSPRPSSFGKVVARGRSVRVSQGSAGVVNTSGVGVELSPKPLDLRASGGSEFEAVNPLKI